MIQLFPHMNEQRSAGKQPRAGEVQGTHDGGEHAGQKGEQALSRGRIHGVDGVKDLREYEDSAYTDKAQTQLPVTIMREIHEEMV